MARCPSFTQHRRKTTRPGARRRAAGARARSREAAAAWRRLETEAVLVRLELDAAQGLFEEEAAARLREHGPNELMERGRKSPWWILGEQVAAVMILALVALQKDNARERIDVGAIVVLNVLLDFV